ncbi:MAG: four-carbon acid sugar kinase family protein [Pseudomonadales bacterium]|nr:four-carbon acid sugar kinase family protein [Pseudomonadales bacterium]MDP6472535.1 four-carbon acid sugar kinase family protein [Pseudomonadales bacterium]MDP6829016.1 four-carbon acid sugar kinase family protein [Pseudomonadales bacterium]MDP6969911.1 four-carbon acid sugar kinase family protein [Pseudomonadales bacterium]
MRVDWGMPSCHVLLSADDRTGALEIGGLIANEQFTVPVGPNAQSERLCVVDITTRHVSREAAQQSMVELLRRNATHRAHKMDAGLRGNWPFEIEVLLEAGHKVAVVCSFPDADRRCKDGVVYIHDLPVLESVFGQDPLNAPVSSRPADVLEHAGVSGDVVVWDADDNEQLHAAIERAAAETRVVVGASGALGAFAQTLYPTLQPRRVPLPHPRRVVCGSLNPLSREQIERTGHPIQLVGGRLDLIDDPAIIATPLPGGDIGEAEALAMAVKVAKDIRAVWSNIGTLIVIGGDTVGAIVGEDTLEVIGTVAPGIPASLYDGVCLITKGGGIGQLDVIRDLLQRSRQDAHPDFETGTST